MEYRITSKHERVIAVCRELSIARTIADSLGSNYRVVAWERREQDTLFDFSISTRTTRQPFNPNTAHWGFPPLDGYYATVDMRAAHITL